MADTVAIEIRLPEPDEISQIAKLWLRSYAPKEEMHNGDPYIRVGRFSSNTIAKHMWLKAHRHTIDNCLAHDRVLVAAYQGSLVGFVCFSLPTDKRPDLTIQYLYVLRSGRRKGIGRQLFDAARSYAPGAGLRTTHITNYWLKFLEGVTGGKPKMVA